jgi:ABC-type polysaccharide/polyol phosphate transport system ATPase subunit
MEMITCDQVVKKFKRHTGQRLLRDHVSSLLRSPRSETFYALKDVTFSVAKGASLGICGSNGAGKSTLLNLISGLGRPDHGHIAVNGRVAALLELGSGFHPDLTGAENLKLNSALLGFSRKQTDTLFASTVEFAGLTEFINEPLRSYSSGMILRLAFSIAMNTDPDVLIIDEVLAVGDQAFQEKCHERIRALRRRGTTFLCVSHSAQMLLSFCDMGLLLDHGKIVRHGNIDDVVEAYQGSTAISANS